MDLHEIEKECRKLNEAKGFGNWLTWENFPKACTYLHSEISEAFEAWRDEVQFQVGEELADLFIRLIHTCYALGYDLEKEYLAKMEKNWKRPPLHGKGKI